MKQQASEAVVRRLQFLEILSTPQEAPVFESLGLQLY